MAEDIRKLAVEMMVSAGITRVQVAKLDDIGYFSAPASAHHHLAYAGGLVEHSVSVTRVLLKITGALDVAWSRPDAPIVVGMLHDLVKCKCYRRATTGGFEYADPGYPGHGSASLAIARELGIELKADEKAAIRWHMGMFDMTGPGDRRDFSVAVDEHGPQVLATHFADWYSAAVCEKKISGGQGA